jgi:hypothetical protein
MQNCLGDCTIARLLQKCQGIYTIAGIAEFPLKIVEGTLFSASNF